MSAGPRLVAVMVGLLAALALLPVAVSQYYVGLVTEMMIYGIFALSLNILLGYTGLPSLGHAAFFGVSGYAVALVSLRVTAQFGLVMGAGLGAAIALSAVFGLLAIRTQGAYFLMITLALAQVVWGIAFKWRAFTGGDDGLPGVRRPSLGGAFPLATAMNFYYFVLVLFVLVVAGLSLFVRSPFGHALRGIRESETRMGALGYNVWLYKYLAFIIAATLAGLAGALFTYYNGFVSPADLGIVLSAKGLLMVILGGAGTLLGPALGAGVIVLLENVISAQTERWLLILGALYVAVVLFTPAGIIGALRSRPPRPVDT